MRTAFFCFLYDFLRNKPWAFFLLLTVCQEATVNIVATVANKQKSNRVFFPILCYKLDTFALAFLVIYETINFFLRDGAKVPILPECPHQTLT